MKKIIAALVMVSGMAFADTGDIPLSSNFQLSSGRPLDARQTVTDATARLALPAIGLYDGLTVYQRSNNRMYQLQGSTSNWVDVTAGGSGGSSALGVNYAGVSITSPTAQLNFKGPGVTLSAVGSTATITISSWPAATPAGSATQVQFNNSGVFGADTNFKWNANQLTLGSNSVAADLRVGVTGSIIYPDSSGNTFTLQAPVGAITSYVNRWPSSQGSSTTTLINDGAGNLTWGNPLARLPLPAGGTNYIQNTDTPQSSSQFDVSSGTVNGPLVINQYSLSGNTTIPTGLYLNSTQTAGSYFSGISFGNSALGVTLSGRFGKTTYNTGGYDGAGFLWQDASANTLMNLGSTGLHIGSNMRSQNTLDVGGAALIGGNFSKVGAKYLGTDVGVTAPANGLAVEGNVAVGTFTATSSQFLVQASTANTYAIYIATSPTGGNRIAISTTSEILLNGSAGGSGQVLTSGGSGAIPTWTTVAGGSGGASTLEVTAGVRVSSPTSTIAFNGSQFTGTLGASSTAQISLNASSVTLQGLITAASLGALTGNQSITVTGDSTGSGTTAIALTAASTQANIKVLSAPVTHTSSVTVTSNLGIGNTYGITTTTITISSNALMGVTTVYANGVIVGASIATTELTGALQAAQEPAHTGDVTNTAGSLAMTAAATQANIRTLSSAMTFASSATFNGTVQISTNVILPGATFYQNGTQQFNSPITVANGGTGTTSPGLVAGTNITSITGTWPNQTINAATQGGGGASTLAVFGSTGTDTTTRVAVSSPTPSLLFDTTNFILTANVSGTTTQIALNPSVTLSTLTFGGAGNPAFTKYGSTDVYQFVGSSGTPTVGHYAAWSSSMALVDGGVIPSATNYIQNTSTLQSGATFYVSSATISGPLHMRGNITMHTSNSLVLNNPSDNGGASIAGNGSSGQAGITVSATGGITINGDGVPVIGIDLKVPFVAVSTITASSATISNLSITGLGSQSCIGTSASGVVQAGTCGGSGGSSSLEVTVGTRISSPTATIAYNASQFTGTLGGSATAQIAVNTSSITALGPDIDLSGAEVTGTLAAARFPALTGDITTSAGSLATTVAATQANIRTFSGPITHISSTTFTQDVIVSSAVLLGGVPGTNGQVFTSAGNGSNPTWTTVSAGSNGSNWNVQVASAGVLSGVTGFNVNPSSITISNAYLTSTSSMTVASQLTVTGISSMTLTNAPLVMSTMTAPTTANLNGTMWHDTTQNAVVWVIGGTTQTLTGTVFTLTASSAATTTVSSTDVMGVGVNGSGVSTTGFTFPANFFTVGKSVYLVASGTFTTTSTPTLGAVVALSTATSIIGTVVSSGAVTTVATGAQQAWTLAATITCRSTGASGVFWANGDLRMINTATTSTFKTLINNANTIDTTKTQALRLMFQWGTSSASNNITATNISVQVLN